ncbi:StbB family protein [Herbaspirillum huttiense]|uniref:StbB family protein n=1 Tax=Herbaspirillum huttiense TaxID=863372 RepID=UPI0037FCBB9F
MKIAVINFSGNVGKSTIANHLLLPRVNGAQYFPVETINSDGRADEAMRGKEFVDLQIKLNIIDEAIVDIGSSNVEDVIKVMSQNPGSHEDFDYFVVPVVPAKKQQRDTISTIDALATLGVPAKKIRLLFNQVEMGDDVESIFSGLFEYQKAEKKFTIRPDAVLHINPLFPKLSNSSATISAILADETDYKEKIKTASSADEKLAYSQMIALKRGAAGAIAELDAAFKALFK